MLEKGEIEAVIIAIQGRKDNRFAITRPSDKSLFEDGETVTFSLNKWKAEGTPQEGQVVILSNMVRFSKGWRANSARSITFSKEK